MSAKYSARCPQRYATQWKPKGAAGWRDKPIPPCLGGADQDYLFRRRISRPGDIEDRLEELESLGIPEDLTAPIRTFIRTVYTNPPAGRKPGAKKKGGRCITRYKTD